MAGKTKGRDGIRILWGIAKSPELGLTDEELHMVVSAHTGKDSIRALTQGELRTVIRVLGDMKESAGGGRSRPRGNPATGSQRKKIYMLARELGWDDPARVDGLCRKMFRVDRVEWLDSGQCSRLIEALKDMGNRKYGMEGGGAGGEKQKDDHTGEKT